MEDNRFSDAMAEFERQIESLPEACGPALRALAGETRKRAAEIREAGEAGEAGRAIAAELLALACANLLVKYARFDAEAHGRELHGEGRNHD